MLLAEMPEMFVAGTGLLVLVGAALILGPVSRRPPRSTATRTGIGGRRTVAVIATAALTIDISKTSTLGFVIPGMRTEYGIEASTASLLAVGGLSGTAVGALLFSRLDARIGRRNCYLVATLGFTATSLCGTMPDFTGNVVMCFLMGMAVGGLAPMLITVLSDLFPGRRRGAIVTGLSVVATAIGYLVAAGSALWLEPVFGWRVLWLIGAPTGLLLAIATAFVPERRTGTKAKRSRSAAPDLATAWLARNTLTVRLQRVYAFAIGLTTFGLTTWVPSLSRAGGLSLATANSLLTGAAVVMVLCAVLLVFAYNRFGPATLTVCLAMCTAVLLVALAVSGWGAAVPWLSAAVLAVTLLAANTMAAVFLPVAADFAEDARRVRVAGSVSFFNRLGGLTGPLLLSLIVSSLTEVLVAIAMLALLCGTVAWYTSHRYRLLQKSTSALD
ncbi:MFS transporter [Amycolatopsis sp. QT-25]|uniref:MFS transporter n=1 Tax=Amycolatopsis sp. QT-25 TaxID=3034022 RepID=UPI0023EDAE80|nr:MFS transporter [Amycolatopsis sp. QT-25]WET76189.1 MFS transporter [Amycolatopsis sp. QT-25]